MVRIWEKLKLVKFCKRLQHNFEKLIRTLKTMNNVIS